MNGGGVMGWLGKLDGSERLLGALERMADALERAYPPRPSQSTDHSAVMFHDPIAEWRRELERAERDTLGLPEMENPPGPMDENGEPWPTK